MKKRILAFVLAGVMTLSMSACSLTNSGTGTASAAASAAAGVSTAATSDTASATAAGSGKILSNGRYEKLNVAIAEDPQDLAGDDVNVGSRYYWIYGVYESLFDFSDDGDGTLHPCLAKSYQAADDNMSWTITLYDDIKDWDGNNITSSDVKYCFDKIIADGQAIRFDYFKDIQIIDDYTFKMDFTQAPPAISELEFPLARTLIFSEKAYKDHNGMTTDPCGTGCYKVKQFVAGSKVVMEANDDYWGLKHIDELQGRHKATVQTLELDVVSEAATAVVGLETGTLDVCSYVPLAMEDEFKTGQYASKYTVEEVTQGDYWYVAPNCESLSKELREAIFYALDNSAICQAMGGQYVPADAFGNSAYKDWDDSLKLTGTYVTDYNVDKAKELLTKAGYSGQDIKLVCVNNETAKAAAQMIQVLMQQVGVNVKINAVTNDTYNTLTGPDGSANWDIIVNTLGGPSMVGSWHLVFDNEVNNGKTLTLVSDDKLQQLYEAANADATHDTEHMRALEDYVVENAYLDVIGNVKTALIYTKNLSKMYYREGYYTPGASTFAAA